MCVCVCVSVQHMHILLTAVRPEIKLFSTCPDTPLFFHVCCSSSKGSSRRPAPRRVKFLMAAVDGEGRRQRHNFYRTHIYFVVYSQIYTALLCIFFYLQILYLLFFIVFLQSLHFTPPSTLFLFLQQINRDNKFYICFTTLLTGVWHYKFVET